MIDHVSISNFKSIQDIEFKCNRLNVFIGHPNTGKSNIIEAMSLYNWAYNCNIARQGTAKSRPVTSIHQFIRSNKIHDLFNNFMVNKEIEVKIDDETISLQVQNDSIKIDINGMTQQMSLDEDEFYLSAQSSKTESFFQTGEVIRMYRYNKAEKHDQFGKDYLDTPSGKNLYSLVLNLEQVKHHIAEILEDFDYKLIRQPHDNKIMAQTEDYVQFDINLLSDTIRSLLFHVAAIRSNHNSILLLEEPEEKNFPFYSKYIAREIINSDNQYFIITHNPYFLSTIIEEVDKSELQVNICSLEEGTTAVQQLHDDDLEELLRADPFFNLEKVMR